MRILILNFDGGNEKGIATWAVLAKEDDKVVAKLVGFVHPSLPQTNNVAEWTALKQAVNYALSEIHRYDEFIFQGDSELVVKQINGEYVVKHENLRPIFYETDVLLGKIASYEILTRHPKKYVVKWIPREKNTEVDALGRTIRT